MTVYPEAMTHNDFDLHDDLLVPITDFFEKVNDHFIVQQTKALPKLIDPPPRLNPQEQAQVH